MEKEIKAILNESIAVKGKLSQDALVALIKRLAELAIICLKNGGKLLFFGNGGSAADAEHLAAELVGRFKQERKALAAIALSGNSANLTCIGNDYDFAQVFSRQIEALGKSGDLAIGISTSGSSPNVLAGLSKAKEMGLATACLTGKAGRNLTGSVDILVCVPSKITARIQEAQMTIGHIICELIEKAFLY